MDLSHILTLISVLVGDRQLSTSLSWDSCMDDVSPVCMCRIASHGEPYQNLDMSNYEKGTGLTACVLQAAALHSSSSSRDFQSSLEKFSFSLPQSQIRVN